MLTKKRLKKINDTPREIAAREICMIEVEDGLGDAPPGISIFGVENPMFRPDTDSANKMTIELRRALTRFLEEYKP